MNYKEAYMMGRQRLVSANIAEAELDARLLLEAVCLTNRSDLLVHGDRSLTNSELSLYEEHLKKREEKIPLQQILGYASFMGLDFKVTRDVLIPRQDTEILVEHILKYLHDGMKILDVCTGSGCILLSLLTLSNHCKGVGVDISEKALEVAKENAKLLEVEANFWESDLFTSVEGTFDIIVSNPPYIKTHVIEELQDEVRLYEPRIALDGAEDGLFFYRKIIEQSPEYLNGGGYLFFEIGHDQGADVSRLMEEAGFLDVTVEKDYAKLDRVVYGYRKSKG